MHRFTSVLLFMLSGILPLQTLAQQDTESWDTYIASYENGIPGSVTLRMDLVNQAPVSKYPYVLLTGILYETSRDDGFPEQSTFKLFSKLSDDLKKVIDAQTENLSVGTFTHNKERLEYYYLADTVGLRVRLEAMYETLYKGQSPYIGIEPDPNWEHYLEFLYPNQETIDYMMDQRVVWQLESKGDKLTTERRVDHWMYFPTEKDLKACQAAVEAMGFNLESAGKIEDSDWPYGLWVWHESAVELNTIYSITSKLRELAKTHNGEYDGWETLVVDK